MLKLLEKVSGYFPYASVRPFQDEFIETVYNAVADGNSVLIEGSNGLGKTVAALSASLPIAKERGLKILYLAKTHRQHDRFIEELREIAKKRSVSGISLRGRREMCLHPLILRHPADARSAMEVCKLLKLRGQCPYYENIERRFDDYVELRSEMASRPHGASEVLEACKTHRFCPYEFVKFMLNEVDVVALSYLYIFNPSIRSAFMKSLETPFRKLLLIVDEAHNLPDTAIGIGSDSLSLFTIRQAEREAREFNYKDLAAFCRKLRKIVEQTAKKTQKEAYVHPEAFVETLRTKADVDEPIDFFNRLHGVGNVIRNSLLSQGKYPRSYIHRVGEFLLKWLQTTKDESYTHLLGAHETRRGTISIRLEIAALDPSRITGPVFSSVYSSIVMSGTLQPLESYTQVLNLAESTVQAVVPPPFPREHILSLVCLGVTTAMKKRKPVMYRKMVKRIAEVVCCTPANVGVFTASYDVLEGLLEAGLENAVDKPLLHEHRGMSSRENDRLVKRFKSYVKRGGAVLLGVQGGRSSEGVDYPGDKMNSVVVVGVPYAEPTPRVKSQIKYYEERFPGRGREHGYMLPALKKASQAAGRPIRTLEDRGAVIFLDYRFATKHCRRFLPFWIRRDMKALPDKDGSIARELVLFFGFLERLS